MISITIGIILFFIFSIHLQSNKNSALNLKINNYFKGNMSIWDANPKKKYYFGLRSIFYLCLLAWGGFSLLRVFFRTDVPVAYFYMMPLLISLFSALLVFKCPRCRSCLFLQDLNMAQLKAPKICTNCGYPSKEISTVDIHKAIRPVFKWLFYIFIALPLAFTLIIVVYLAATGRLT